MRISRELEPLFRDWVESNRRADQIVLTQKHGLPVRAVYDHDHVRGGKREIPAVYEFRDWEALSDSTRAEYLALLEEETSE